ncbi:MAG: type II secretion system F family protein [Muribaculaceae bacterium]|nr:type II secretion system F family protein [Roseburia sp.]MCM1430502.1 type II secretion system F family protein [Muribaculaceae bacterium]MCM1493175.1 type II secretion system F family protein [Muribaculaceae bacterium]
MPEFTYKAIDRFGKEKKGNITIDSLEAAYESLRSDGMTPMEVNPASLLTREVSISIGGSVKPRDLSVFCRQFISMIDAGVTIIDSLAMLEEQTENKTMASAIGGVKMEIGKGETLANALALYPKVFPDIMVKMVNAGEASGKLDVAFDRMATHFEKSAKLKAIMKKAAVYPIMVGLVAVIVVVVMLAFVIPKYTEMFETMDFELPALTVAVVKASDFVMQRWYILIAIVLAVVFGIKAFKKTPTGQLLFAKLSKNAPIFGKLTVKTAASNFSRTLSTLIYSGLPMVEALAITAGTMSNFLYREKLEQTRDEVIRGVPLSEPLLRDDLFPPMVGHMAKIGEETGDLEGMLNKLADYYDEEVEMATQTVLAAMEPMIILVLAGAVILLLGAVMAPMLAMYNQMDNL